ncbi:MAG TPA: DUF3551 domain-containing protein [Xanthobacteraceae bacterium]|nr:DUF3551 domain-containing protein [Xanthobacteraceae bacterium]
MSIRYLIAAASVAFAALPDSANAQQQQYPWCTQGSAIHCYYMTRQQCQEAVDYHGFCIPNPDYSARSGSGRRQAPQ